MSCILHIETSTQMCSVAVSEDSQVIYHEEEHTSEKGSAAERLGTLVDEALSFTDSHAIPFDAVAVSCGPGSYTGLRIGVSMAKGICFGRDLKLIAVPTLELLCVPVLLNPAYIPEDEEDADKTPLFCPMIDARRMEVYAGLYDRALRPIREVRADVVDANTYREWLDQRPVYFFGNGAAKCKDIINHPNARFIDNIEPQARWMQPLAERRLLQGQTEDVAYFEPFYLKDYVAKMPKNLLNP
jgi:tRNA threonylcarbamoyladenosine biosynthesis protein TsaB